MTEGQHAESHKGVVTLFGLLFVKTGKLEKTCGRILASLRDDRESGDYERFPSWTRIARGMLSVRQNISAEWWKITFEKMDV